MPGYLSHLGLTAWPFSIVPRQQFCNFLAGRKQLREDINSLLVGLSRRDTSSIHVLWSWFGAGKTHSLYYLASQAKLLAESAGVTTMPIYTEFPKRARGFFDLYQAAMLSIDTDVLSDSFMEAMTSPNWGKRFHELSNANPDLSAAFRNIIMGNTLDKATAIRWLRGDALAISEFRRLGISQRISTADQAVRTLAAVIEICDIGARSKGRQGHRIVWILDEFQRLERCGSAVAREINAGLHSLFNSCPTGLSLVISFSGPPDPKRLPPWLSPELRDRIGATKVLVLPPLQHEEAFQFVQEVLKQFRTPGFDASNDLFPFTKEAVQFVISHLSSKTELRPRILMHALNALLEAADAQLEQGKLNKIDRAFAENILKDYVIVIDEEPDGDGA